MLDRFVGDGEFSKVVTNHFRLDFDLSKALSVVDTDNRSNHFRDNQHVTEVSLDNFGLFIGTSLLLGLAQLLDEGHGLALKTALHSSAGTGVDNFHELRVRERGVKCEFLNQRVSGVPVHLFRFSQGERHRNRSKNSRDWKLC